MRRRERGRPSSVYGTLNKDQGFVFFFTFFRVESSVLTQYLPIAVPHLSARSLHEAVLKAGREQHQAEGSASSREIRGVTRERSASRSTPGEMSRFWCRQTLFTSLNRDTSGVRIPRLVRVS